MVKTREVPFLEVGFLYFRKGIKPVCLVFYALTPRIATVNIS